MIPGFFATTNKNLVQSNPPFSFGNALQFDGTNDNLIYSLVTLSGEFTLSIWWYPTSLPAGGSVRCLFGNSTSYRHALALSANDIGLTINSGTTLPIAPTSSLSINNWYHIVATRDSLGNIYGYVNGVKYYNAVSNNTLLLDQTNYNQLHSISPAGKVDDYVIWSKHLTDSQVLSLYNNGEGNDPITIEPNNLELYYALNEESGSIALDLSSNNNNGTLVSFDLLNCWVAH